MYRFSQNHRFLSILISERFEPQKSLVQSLRNISKSGKNRSKMFPKCNWDQFVPPTRIRTRTYLDILIKLWLESKASIQEEASNYGFHKDNGLLASDPPLPNLTTGIDSALQTPNQKRLMDFPRPCESGQSSRRESSSRSEVGMSWAASGREP